MNTQNSSGEFDAWAETYDQSVAVDQFPFYGYQAVIQKVVALAEVQPGMQVLDLGAGTGNLAIRFAALGCELWCTDFSAPMLAKGGEKLPAAHFYLHDLRTALPPELNRSFDRIISAYVFHHFELAEKVRILKELAAHLTPAGWIVIGDIAFPDAQALEDVKRAVDGEWEDEYYWMAEEAIPALERAGFKVEYSQVSPCEGVFVIRR